MVKHSKRNRRRMHQSGMGGGFTIVHRLPRRPRQLPRLSAAAERRAGAPAALRGVLVPGRGDRGRDALRALAGYDLSLAATVPAG